MSSTPFQFSQKRKITPEELQARAIVDEFAKAQYLENLNENIKDVEALNPFLRRFHSNKNMTVDKAIEKLTFGIESPKTPLTCE